MPLLPGGHWPWLCASWPELTHTHPVTALTLTAQLGAKWVEARPERALGTPAAPLCRPTQVGEEEDVGVPRRSWLPSGQGPAPRHHLLRPGLQVGEGGRLRILLPPGR